MSRVNIYRLFERLGRRRSDMVLHCSRADELEGRENRPFVEKYFNWFSLVFVVLLIGGFLVVK